jgi:hypothetical protein
MRAGLGGIVIKLRAVRFGHHLRFENRHLPQVSVYLMNCLASPSDGLVVRRQERDEAQRSIEFEYSFGGGASPGPWAAWVPFEPFWPGAVGMLLAARMAMLIYRARHEKKISQFAVIDNFQPGGRKVSHKCRRSRQALRGFLPR